MAVNYIPEGYHTVTPYLTVRGADKLLEFIKRAFGAEETFRMARPDGAIAHAEARVGDSMVMMGEAPEAEDGQTPGTLHLYVEDVDRVYQRALDAGASTIRGPQDQFYGDRTAGVRDMCGNQWWIATHIEDLSPEEIAKRQQVSASAE